MKVNFGRLMLNNAKLYADQEALVNVEKNRRYTFMELHLLTNQICNMMRDQLGLKMGDIYANLLKNENNSMFSFWMCKGEATGFWMDYFDNFDAHLYQLDYIKPKVIFIEDEVLDQYYEALRQRNIVIVCMEKTGANRAGVYYFWDLLEQAPTDETNVEYEYEEHTIILRFTGGTTGRGKAVMYTLSNIMSAVHQFYGYTETLVSASDRFLHVAPISHGTVFAVLPVFFRGAANITINYPELDHICAAIQQERITSTFVVPTLLYRLLDSGLEKTYDLSSLRTVIYAAAPMSPAKLEMLQKRFGNIFVQPYGSSEAFPPITILGKGEHIVKNEEDRKRISSAGRPVTGVELLIMDDHEKEVPDGEVGEVWVRASSVTQAYYRDPEQTAAEFSPNGFWKSGDMGYIDEKGYLFIVDRKKDMIISGGFNVYAAEVENAINSNPAVEQSVVIGIPHEEWGESVHAEVVLKEGMQISAKELIDYCKKTLGKYKVPKTITFVDQLTTNGLGKVARKGIREKYWKGQERLVH